MAQYSMRRSHKVSNHSGIRRPGKGGILFALLRVVEHLSVTELSHNSMVAHLSPYPPTVQTRRTKVQSSQSLINDSGDVHSTCSPFLTTSVPTMPFPSSVAHAVNFVPQATITDLR